MRVRSSGDSAEPGLAASLLHVFIVVFLFAVLLIGNGRGWKSIPPNFCATNHFQASIMADTEAVIPQLKEKPDFVLKSLAKHQRGQNVSIKVCPFSLCLCNSRKSKTGNFGETCKSCKPDSVKPPTMPPEQKCFSRKIRAIWKLKEWRRHTSSLRSN